jgi:hypothetical protein
MNLPWCSYLDEQELAVKLFLMLSIVLVITSPVALKDGLEVGLDCSIYPLEGLMNVG